MAITLKNFQQRYRLQPLNELNRNDLELLYDRCEIQDLAPRTLIIGEPDLLIYLLEGEVSLLAGGFVTEKFNHLDSRALRPLFNDSLDEDSAILTSHGMILSVDKPYFDGLYTQAQAQLLETSELNLSDNEQQLFQSLMLAFNHKKLPLPALPEAALKIRQAINQPNVGSAEIIQIVQTDPVLSARLVKVANSPLYGTWREIKTVRDAVRRLGLETTRNLSFSLSVKQLFKAKTSVIKSYIHKIYNESTAISAIAFAITAQQVPELDPEQAMLGGLIQKIGQIPILKFIDENPSMMQSISELDRSIDNLKVPVSTLILNEWNFDPEFVELVEQAENWQRDTGEAIDYCDVLIAARLIYLSETGDLPVFNLDEVPVIRKLRLHEYDDEGQFFMDKAKEQVEDMQRLLKVG